MKHLLYSLLIGLVLRADCCLAIPAAKVPLFSTLGDHTRPITTRSPEAQDYFDQGLRFLFGFNHGMAIRSFQEAARIDPECAMAHWGIALACGPHINYPEVPRERAQDVRAAVDALGKRGLERYL